MSVFLTGRRVLEEGSSTQEHGTGCSWSTLDMGCGDQVVIPTSTAQPLGKHCQAVVGKGMGPSCRTAHLPLPPQSLRAGCDEVSLDISTNYLISYFHFEQSLFWRLVIALATPLPLLCIPGVFDFFKPELSHIFLGKSLSSAYDCCEFLNFLIWVLFVHHLAAFPWKASNFFCLFFKGYRVAPYIFWVLVGHTKPNINLESVFLLPRSLVSKGSEGMPLSACPMDGEDFQAPGLVNTEPLANTKLQKDDDKQTSCQSSLSADRFSPSPPSSSLVLLCFRAKIPKYVRKKGLLGRINPLCLHCSSSCFPVSKPHWVHLSLWAEEEERTGRDLLRKWG